MNNIILCADDYAQNEAICEGILQLVTQSRVNAISCMTNHALWSNAQQALSAVQHTTWIGLHLNFTQGAPQSDVWRQQVGTTFPTLTTLLRMIYLRRLDPRVVMAEIEAQIDAFTHAMNQPPDFIDGHQHIHQFPIIRECLLTLYAQRKLSAFIRQTSNGWRDLINWSHFPKTQLIALLGGIRFKHRINKQAIPTNQSFAGIYTFTKAQHYRDAFKTFLSQTTDGGLIMCHPGMRSEDASDPLYRSRYYEFDYLSSDTFLQDLVDSACCLKQKVVA